MFEVTVLAAHGLSPADPPVESQRTPGTFKPRTIDPFV